MTAAGPASRTLALTAAAMLAFAGNSLLCRLALKSGAIDPVSFTAVRLLAGALALLLILRVRGVRIDIRGNASALGAGTLFLYAAAFSFAYVSLDAASGALLLFGFVQATMIVAALLRGERPRPREVSGWCMAAAGLTWLLLPGATAPSYAGAALMAIAGIAWGLYSLHGHKAAAALPSTAANFVLSLPLLPLLLLAAAPVPPQPDGILLAAASGAITSGIGYVLWYAALAHLRSLQAALVQLSVPAITALGGVALLAETPGWRLAGAEVLILGGIALALTAKQAPKPA